MFNALNRSCEVRYYLSRYAPPFSQDRRRRPLIAACAAGRADDAARLLDHGAPVDAAPGPDKLTALMAACGGASRGYRECWPACVELLLRHGASTKLRDDRGFTPLSIAALSLMGMLTGKRPIGGNQPASCIALLLDYGADVTAPFDTDDECGRNFLNAMTCLGRWRSIDDNGMPWADEPAWHGAVDLFIARSAALTAAVAPGLLNAKSAHGGPSAEYYPPLFAALLAGRPAAVRALCALGADAHAFLEFAPGNNLTTLHFASVLIVTSEVAKTAPTVFLQDFETTLDELIERGADPLAEGVFDEEIGPATGFCLGVTTIQEMWTGGDDGKEELSEFGVRFLRRLALQLARWPQHAPLPEQDYSGLEVIVLPAALEHARWRLEVLQGGRDGGTEVQRQLTAAFLLRVRDACGGAVAPAYAPFARLRFVHAAGGLDGAWAQEREIHRFPVERVSLKRAALLVATAAEAEAARRCIELLIRASSAVITSPEQQPQPPAADETSDTYQLPPPPAPAMPPPATTPPRTREEETRVYSAVRLVARWNELRAAVARAEGELRAAEIDLGAAIEEAEAAIRRLEDATARQLQLLSHY